MGSCKELPCFFLNWHPEAEELHEGRRAQEENPECSRSWQMVMSQWLLSPLSFRGKCINLA